ncbi:MAG TPA: Crp/Fnr family transcriptional regulator, partial [Phaeodactylibacter sp.]|nr:Crp/Fnr family transcriptional regulator [Phaeodactylibacter sp.]
MKDKLERKLPPLPLKLKNEILEKGILKTVPAGTELLREGQYVKVVPLVLEGLIKVFGSYEDRELLLYYIEPTESCIMSFSAGLWNAPSKVFAVTERDSELLLLPVQLMNEWVKEYPSLNNLFFQQFAKRYEDLLLTIHHLLFDKMDKRLYEFLKMKSELFGETTLDLRHHQIA